MELHVGRLIDHLRAGDLEASRRFYRGVLRALGRDLTREGPGFFSADERFVTSADGNNVELVHHGPARRSAPSVVIRAEP